MLTDKSDNFYETWKFLDRRFEDKKWVEGNLHLVYNQNELFNFGYLGQQYIKDNIHWT